MNINKSKIALGTVQFGMDYGINNKRGKVPPEEVFAILDKASENGIDVLDTAYAYEDSEALIGKYMQAAGERFDVISKLPECNQDDVTKYFDVSARRLGVSSLYGYMLHSFDSYKEHPEVWDVLRKLKAEGKMKKIGISIYHPHELEYIFDNNIEIDIIQFPYSIFDQRFSEYFQAIKERNIEIHVRSVFLQGFVFKNPDDLETFFSKMKEKLSRLNSISNETSVPIVALCLNFAILNEHIDKVVVGVDSLDNLEDILLSVDTINDVKAVYDGLLLLREMDENMILPINWKR